MHAAAKGVHSVASGLGRNVENVATRPLISTTKATLFK